MKMSNRSIAFFLLATSAVTAVCGVNSVRNHRQRLLDKKTLKKEKLTWEGEGGNLVTPAASPRS